MPINSPPPHRVNSLLQRDNNDEKRRFHTLTFQRWREKLDSFVFQPENDHVTAC